MSGNVSFVTSFVEWNNFLPKQAPLFALPTNDSVLHQANNLANTSNTSTNNTSSRTLPLVRKELGGPMELGSPMKAGNPYVGNLETEKGSHSKASSSSSSSAFKTNLFFQMRNQTFTSAANRVTTADSSSSSSHSENSSDSASSVSQRAEETLSTDSSVATHATDSLSDVKNLQPDVDKQTVKKCNLSPKKKVKSRSICVGDLQNRRLREAAEKGHLVPQNCDFAMAYSNLVPQIVQRPLSILLSTSLRSQDFEIKPLLVSALKNKHRVVLQFRFLPLTTHSVERVENLRIGIFSLIAARQISLPDLKLSNLGWTSLVRDDNNHIISAVLKLFDWATSDFDNKEDLIDLSPAQEQEKLKVLPSQDTTEAGLPVQPLTNESKSLSQAPTKANEAFVIWRLDAALKTFCAALSS